MANDEKVRRLKEWQKRHWRKVSEILSGKGDPAPDYFLYANLKKNHPAFCPLFRQNKICHAGITEEEFCCLFCACPYFLAGKKENDYGFCEYPGNSGRRLANGLWDCSDCSFIHDISWSRENIAKISEFMQYVIGRRFFEMRRKE